MKKKIGTHRNPLLEKARLQHQLGKLTTAKRLYQKIVAKDKSDYNALFLLATLQFQEGYLQQSRKLFERVVTLAPGFAEAYSNLGLVLIDLNEFSAAESCCKKAISLAPDLVPAHTCLGMVLERMGKISAAISAYQNLFSMQRQNHELCLTIALLLIKNDQPSEAVEWLTQAVGLQPDYVQAYIELGKILYAQGKYAEAVQHLDRACGIRADDAVTLLHVGSIFFKSKEYDRALLCCRNAIQLKEDSAEAHFNLATVLRGRGSLDEAVVAYKDALRYARGDTPESRELIFSIASDLFFYGLVEEAQEANERLLTHGKFPKALQLDAFISNYLPKYNPSEIFAKHQAWGELVGNAQKSAANFANIADKKRRLRIGYVSPDFKDNVIFDFFHTILGHHNVQETDIYCYSLVEEADNYTQLLKDKSAHWRDVSLMANDEIAGKIREDMIDILVDLAGHTTYRAELYAVRHAPVQVTYLGYPNTTGLQAMDYRLTDRWADPEENDAYYTEQIFPLPPPFLCYRPRENAPEVSPLPAQKNGYITFGSFNNFSKVTPDFLSLWAQILQEVPQSRLVLKGHYLFNSQEVQDRIRAFFAARGVEDHRIQLFGWLSEKEAHLKLYQQIDLALDTYPYNGTTTTCEALWMGVPVVTMAGRRHASRVGLSLLSSQKLERFVARNQDEYLTIAVAASLDVSRLAQMRSSLRSNMSGSPLCNQTLFVGNLEKAYREMWERWCEGQLTDRG